MTNLQELRRNLEQQKGRKAQIQSDIDQTSTSIRTGQKKQGQCEEAAEIIRTVGLATQEQLEFHISDIVSMALEACNFDYRLVVQFLSRRGQNECDLFFEREESLMDPLDASGGGAVDVASLALRAASWSMMRPKLRPTIVLDEPMKFVDGERIHLAAQMIKEISEKLGVQFIIVTHKPELAEGADKVFNISINKKTGISKVEEG